MSAPHGGLAMELDIVGLVGGCSYALDCIEAEFVLSLTDMERELPTSAYVWQKDWG